MKKQGVAHLRLGHLANGRVFHGVPQRGAAVEEALGQLPAFLGKRLMALVRDEIDGFWEAMALRSTNCGSMQSDRGNRCLAALFIRAMCAYSD